MYKLISWSISLLFSAHNPFLKLSKKYIKICNYLYSQRYCYLFKCENVYFKRKVNFTKGEKYFFIGNGSTFGKLAVLTAWDYYEGVSFTPQVIIGENCNFGYYLHLTCINKILIGNGVLTGRWVTMSDNGHGNTHYQTLQMPPIQRKLSNKGVVEIADNVWIGDKVTILSGVRIGEGSVIAANAVVTKDVPPYSVAAGNPAKIIKQIKIEYHE